MKSQTDLLNIRLAELLKFHLPKTQKLRFHSRRGKSEHNVIESRKTFTIASDATANLNCTLFDFDVLQSKIAHSR